MGTTQTHLTGAFAAAAILLALTGVATAQVSVEQQSALRSNCRGDFMSKCSGVSPGGKEALACLQKNVATLSAGCKAVVSGTMPKPHSETPPPAPAPTQAVTAPPPPVQAAPPPAPVAPAAAAAPPPAPPPPAAAAPPPAPPKATAAKPPAKPVKPVAAAAAPTAPSTPTAAQQSAMRSACRSDFMTHCSGVSPGGKDALACLQRNVTALSPSCKSVVSGTMAAPAKPATAAAIAPVPAPGAPAAAPSPEKLNALKFTCRRDFDRHCKGVPPGPEAFMCLQAHQAQLSPNCRTSVASIADDMPVGVAMPAPVVPDRPIANAVVMLRACKLDLLRHCRGVEPGGGREIACLAAHEDSLSVRCRMARRVSAPVR